MLTTNEKALDEFITTIGDIGTMLQKIEQYNDNHWHTDPDKVNWSNVGDAKAVKTMLQEVLNFIEGKDDH